jgi:periplasmic protein TonB
MAVQILNDMPDVAIHRGDPAPVARPKIIDTERLEDWSPRASVTKSRSARPTFIAITVGLHVVAALAFMSIRQAARTTEVPPPMEASLIDAPAAADELPPMTPPPMSQVVYTLPTPELSIETESITLPPPTPSSNAIAPSPLASIPPLVESVQYVRPPAPVYPRESNRRHERGTVLLRVLVDSQGRPAQIQLERSSGFERLDAAAREAVQNALFQPHEVNGVPQAAQVLIPIEFTRRAS